MITFKKNQSVKENNSSDNLKLTKKVLDREVLDAIKNGKSYKTVKDLFKDIDEK